MAGYQHQECGRCGAEIGFNEEYADFFESVLCMQCNDAIYIGLCQSTETTYKIEDLTGEA